MISERRLALTLLALAWVPAGSPAAAADAGAIERIMAEPAGLDGPGCAVAVVQSGRATVHSAGAADLEKHRAIDADTQFYAASLSKRFTALLVTKLALQGKLSLDDDVRKWIPEMSIASGQVTLRMLLNHTSGIRDVLDLMRMAGVDSLSGVERRSALEMLYRQRGTNFPPGTAWSYSNGGYLLLSEVVTRVSGKPFAQFARENIFAPLDMSRSYFLDDAAPDDAANVAHGYVVTGDTSVVRDTYPRFSGSGGLMTSVNDLAKFERDVQVDHTVWTKAIAEQIAQPGRLMDGRLAIEPVSGLPYSAGLLVGERRGKRWMQHGGGAEGFRHLYASAPEQGLSVILLCNRGGLTLQPKVDALFEAVSPTIFQASTPNYAGRYYSRDLDATYLVTPRPNGLWIEVSSRWTGKSNGVPAALYAQTPQGYWAEVDRSFGPQLWFELDGRSFSVDRDGIRGVRFDKVVER